MFTLSAPGDGSLSKRRSEGSAAGRRTVSAGGSQVIPPQRRHHVEFDGPAIVVCYTTCQPEHGVADNMAGEQARLAFDLNREDPKTRDRYGRNPWGQQCLLARRFCEAGVRFIQVTYGDSTANPAWDQHSNLPKHADHARAVDQPIAALLMDLKQRGLLEDTIVWWGSEFGRAPYAQANGTGRDHNPEGFTVWLAGGGFKPGLSFGETDDFGHRAVIGRVHMHDLHATILHQLGLDHEKLTYRHAGRDYRLTDIAGKVVQPILKNG